MTLPFEARQFPCLMSYAVARDIAFYIHIRICVFRANGARGASDTQP